MATFARYRKSLANGLLTHKLLQILAARGVVIEPYYFYREPRSRPEDAVAAEFEFFEAGPADQAGIAALDPKSDSRAAIARAFRGGKRCFALRHGGRIVAATWCDVREIDFEPCRRPLGPGEAYLYGMETLYSYRGHNLAPSLRALCHARLMEEGRPVVYSYTDRFNRPAVRFKEKIGAEVLFTGLFVKIFGITLLNRGPRGADAGVPSGAGRA
jgi:hypothetical protein